MASPAAVRPPWSCCKRIRVSPQPGSLTRSPFHQRRQAYSSSSTDEEQDQRPQRRLLHYDEPREVKFKPVGDDVKAYIRNELFELAAKRNVPLPPSIAPTFSNDDTKKIAQHEDPESPEPTSMNSITSPSRTYPRLPRSVQSIYLAPLKRQPTHRILTCNVQFRSYSARNLEFTADLALRAAYYLDLPARGAAPLPRITERWTVPKDSFIFKKAQENFERITMRRVVQIWDGDLDVVRIWLGVVRKWAWYGVGIKADIWEHESLEDALNGSKSRSETEMEAALDTGRWELFGRRKGVQTKGDVAKFLDRQGFSEPPTTPSTPTGVSAK